jgi:hypothetical protein
MGKSLCKVMHARGDGLDRTLKEGIILLLLHRPKKRCCTEIFGMR